MPVVDASVWVAHFVADDAFHNKSRKWLEKALEDGEDIFFPVVALAEVASAITRVTRDEKLALTTVTAMLSGLYSAIPIDDNLGLKSAKVATQCRLRGFDAIYAALAQSFDQTLITLDKELAERASSIVKTLIP